MDLFVTLIFVTVVHKQFLKYYFNFLLYWITSYAIYNYIHCLKHIGDKKIEISVHYISNYYKCTNVHISEQSNSCTCRY